MNDSSNILDDFGILGADSLPTTNDSEVDLEVNQESDNIIVDSSDSLPTTNESDVDVEVNQEDEQIISDDSEYQIILQSVPVDSTDYTQLLESIDSRLEYLESVDYSQQLQDISDNGFRLYYFVGGLYVAFAIVLAIKFLKIFF